VSSLTAVNASTKIFDVKSSSDVSNNLLKIASNLLTTDPSFYGNNLVLSTNALKLLRSLFPDEAKFQDKKVRCYLVFCFITSFIL
jgi:hypothetical protein